MMPKRLALVLVSGVVLATTIISLELLVRAKRPQKVYNEAKASSMPIFAESPHMVFTTKPSTSIDFSGYTGEFASRVAINSMGLRGKEVNPTKPEKMYRILVTGDSMVFGWGVNDEGTFSVQLERMLQNDRPEEKIEVINAGFTSGNGPMSAYLYLKQYGLSLNPDLVVVTVFSHNDLGDLEEDVWKNIGEDGLPTQVISSIVRVDDGYLVARQQPIRYRFPILRNSHLFQLVINHLQRWGLVQEGARARDYSQPYCLEITQCKQAYEKYQEVIRGFVRLSQESRVPMAVLFLPSPWQVEKGVALMRAFHHEEIDSGTLSARIYDNGLRLGNFEPRKTLMQYTQDAGLQVIDVLPEMTTKDWHEYYYGQDGHLTTTGHQKVAEALRVAFINKHSFYK